MLVYSMMLATTSLSDPTRLLDRASNLISKGKVYLGSYQDSVRFTSEHAHLSDLILKLDVLSKELDELSQDVRETR
jgi:hypothetical protein